MPSAIWKSNFFMVLLKSRYKLMRDWLHWKNSNKNMGAIRLSSNWQRCYRFWWLQIKIGLWLLEGKLLVDILLLILFQMIWRFTERITASFNVQRDVRLTIADCSNDWLTYKITHWFVIILLKWLWLTRVLGLKKKKLIYCSYSLNRVCQTQPTHRSYQMISPDTIIKTYCIRCPLKNRLVNHKTFQTEIQHSTENWKYCWQQSVAHLWKQK